MEFVFDFASGQWIATFSDGTQKPISELTEESPEGIFADDTEVSSAGARAFIESLLQSGAPADVDEANAAIDRALELANRVEPGSFVFLDETPELTATISLNTPEERSQFLAQKPPWWPAIKDYPPLTDSRIGVIGTNADGSVQLGPVPGVLDEAAIMSEWSRAVSRKAPGAVDWGISLGLLPSGEEGLEPLEFSTFEAASAAASALGWEVGRRGNFFTINPSDDVTASNNLDRAIDAAAIAGDQAELDRLLGLRKQIDSQTPQTQRLTLDQTINQLILAGKGDEARRLFEIQRSVFAPVGTGINALQAAQLIGDLAETPEEFRQWMDALTGAGDPVQQAKFAEQITPDADTRTPEQKARYVEAILAAREELGRDVPFAQVAAKAEESGAISAIPASLVAFMPPEILAIIQESIGETPSVEGDVAARVDAIKRARAQRPGATTQDVLRSAGLAPPAADLGPAPIVPPGGGGVSETAIDVPLEGLSRATSLQRVPAITTQTERLAAERDRDEAFSAGQGVESPAPILTFEERLAAENARDEAITAAGGGGFIGDPISPRPAGVVTPPQGGPEPIPRTIEDRRADVERRRAETNIGSTTTARGSRRLNPQTGEFEERETPASITGGLDPFEQALFDINKRRQDRDEFERFRKTRVPTKTFS